MRASTPRSPTTAVDAFTGTPTHASTVLSALFVLIVICLLLGAEAYLSMSLMMFSAGALAVLGFLGERVPWARLAALGLLSVIALVLYATFASQAEALIELRRELGDPIDAATATASGDALLGRIRAFAFAGMAVAAVFLLVPVRRLVAHVLPIDPRRLVHAIALSLAIAVIAIAFAPLVVMGEPVSTALAQPQSDAIAASGSLWVQVFELLLLIPVCMLAVGLGLKRSIADVLDRLGLSRPTPKQILQAVGLAFVLVLVVSAVSAGVNSIWNALAWPTTNQEGLDALMGHLISPAGVLIVGISAGLGEELLVRGVLQPRLGIVLSNVAFTAMHAGQYGWDLLIPIFVVGLGFGLVRKYGNTTQSAIVHGLYDAILISIALSR